MDLKIEIPQIDDWKKVNELARQVQEIHVQWRPDLFINVDNVITQEDFEIMVENKEIVVVKL